jgi:hypothetical protein
MIPVYQTIPGPNGNCFAACVASILEWDLDELPDLDEDWGPVLKAYLGACGWDVRFVTGPPPAGYAIAAKRVRDGSIHSVVCRDGKIVHDPSPRPFARDEDPTLLWTVIRTQSCFTPS